MLWIQWDSSFEHPNTFNLMDKIFLQFYAQSGLMIINCFKICHEVLILLIPFSFFVLRVTGWSLTALCQWAKQCHCVVSLSKTMCIAQEHITTTPGRFSNHCLVLVQPTKTCPDITEKLLIETVRNEIKQKTRYPFGFRTDHTQWGNVWRQLLSDILEDFENASPYFCSFLANRICKWKVTCRF